MKTYYLAFALYAYLRHVRDGHHGNFETCHRRTCRRARQLEIYLILTDQYIEAAHVWQVGGGRG